VHVIRNRHLLQDLGQDLILNNPHEVVWVVENAKLFSRG
jgi:hypothetical protein